MQTHPAPDFAGTRPTSTAARSLCSVLAVAALLVSTQSEAAPSFVGVGDLNGGTVSSDANGVSADGIIVTGTSNTAVGSEAFIWTAGAGLLGVGDLPGGSTSSNASHISADGSTIVGNSESALGTEAFRRTDAGGMVGLGSLGGAFFFSAPHQSADDGRVVVGDSFSLAGFFEAFRWTGFGGMVSLGDLPGGSVSSSARGCSIGCNTVVGFSVGASGVEAFSWTSVGGMTGLGDLSGGSFNSHASAITPDASSIVGFGTSASGQEAFRWTSAGGMVGLGDLAGGAFLSSASGVTSDGETVVGSGSIASGQAAVIWDATNGMRELAVVLTGLGLDLTGWTLTNATAISGDGRVIVGRGTNPSGDTEGWVAAFDAPSLPPPADADRFLTYLSAAAPEHTETLETAKAYLAAIDPDSARTTLNDWLGVNGFLPGAADAEAIYVNDADLGFGRHMFVKTHPDGRVVSYVKNHGDNAPSPDPVDGSTDEKIANAHNDLNLIATVVMEYGPPPNNPAGAFYTRFLAFGEDGIRVTEANLDSRGAKFLPGLCNTCHGGNARPLLADGTYPDEGDTGAGFLPWDLDTLGFTEDVFAGSSGGSPSALYNQANQEAAFKAMNQAVLLTNPTPAAREVIEGWYGGAGTPNATFNGGFVPMGWAGHEAAYRSVYAPNCRACHVMRNPAVAFQTYSEFETLQPRGRHLVFDRAIMPLARRTYDRFWSGLSVFDPAVIDLFGDVAVDRLPGRVPVAYAGPDQSAKVGVLETLDASASSFATSLLWNFTELPVGSAASLSNPVTANPTFIPDLPGVYKFNLNASNSEGSNLSSVIITATSDGGLAGVDFVSAILPIYASICRSCHNGAGASPDFDGPGTVIDSAEYNEAVYRSFAGRAAVIDPPNSLLFQKATGAISHGGGPALAFGTPQRTAVLDWISQGAVRVTTPGYHKNDGNVVNPILQYTLGGPAPFSTHPYAGPSLEPSANLPGADLELAFLINADLSNANLSNANLRDADLGNASLFRAILVGADLTNANFSGASLLEVDLSNAIGVTPAQIESASDLNGVGLATLNLAGVNLHLRFMTSSNVSGANLSGADMSEAFMGFADFSGANVTGANFTDLSLHAANFANVMGLTNAQIESARPIMFDIQLTGLDLSGVNLSARTLSGANFTGTDLMNSIFSGAALDGVNFSGANLRGANLNSAVDLGTTTGNPTYDLTTDFTGTGFDPVAAGWILDLGISVPLLGPLGVLWFLALLGITGWRRSLGATPI